MEESQLANEEKLDNPRGTVVEVLLELFEDENKIKKYGLNDSQIKKFVTDIEKGIYNKTIQYSNDKNVLKKII